MFNKLKSAAVAVLVATAVAVAAAPMVTFQAQAADAPAKPVKAKKVDACADKGKKSSKEYKDCKAAMKKGSAKKMDNMKK
jgi:hypothetical protein